MRTLANVAVLACGFAALLTAPSCWLVGHDSERRPPEADDFVMYWSVTDTNRGEELSRGCGLSSERVDKIRFRAPIGAQVTETVLFEHVGKPAGEVAKLANREAADAFWCSKESDLFRIPAEFKQDLDCLRVASDSRAAKITSRDVIKGGIDAGMGGYRLGLEITGTGT